MAKKRKAKRSKKPRPRQSALPSPDSPFSKMTMEQLKAVNTKDLGPFESTAWQVEMMQREEPLHQHLHSCIDATMEGYPCLKHPLFVGPIDPNRAALAHWLIEQKGREIEKAVKAQKWYEVVFFHEKIFLDDAFREYENHFDDPSYWLILGRIWTQQEQLWPNRKWFLQVFKSPRPKRDHLMSPEEHDVLEALPDMFQIYRGFIGNRGEGLSWSLDRAKAEWFARRFSILTELGQPQLMVGVIKKKDVLAYFDGREEKEIVVDPAKVRSMKVEPVTPSKNDDGDE
jgi:hypothetical protein